MILAIQTEHAIVRAQNSHHLVQAAQLAWRLCFAGQKNPASGEAGFDSIG
jgi:hypothetical protein